MMTAQILAQTLDHDGTRWVARDDRSLTEIACHLGGQVSHPEQDVDLWVFPDGSEIEVRPSGWATPEEWRAQS